MKEAIQKAIEGGFRAERGLTLEYVEKHYSEYEIECLTLRSTFWQSLGKALGWKGGEIRVCYDCGRAIKHNEVICGCGGNSYDRYSGQWLIEWHRFIDHLASGGDPEEFFKTLLK